MRGEEGNMPYSFYLQVQFHWNINPSRCTNGIIARDGSNQNNKNCLSVEEEEPKAYRKNKLSLDIISSRGGTYQYNDSSYHLSRCYYVLYTVTLCKSLHCVRVRCYTVLRALPVISSWNPHNSFRRGMPFYKVPFYR